MASRAELIMAQVRGGLAQEYREKGPTTGEGIIQDLTGAALGYNTATEAMYALEGGVKDFYAEDRVQKRTERRLNRQDRRALRKETRAVNKAMDADFESWADDGSENEIYNPEGRPGTRPDAPDVTYGPEPGVDTTPPLILPSEKIIEENLEAATGNLYLAGTLDTNYTNIGMFSTTFSESTKYKFDVDLNTINNQIGPQVFNRDAFGASQFAAGAPTDTIASDAKTIQGRINLNYLLGTTTPALPEPVRPEMGLPVQDEEEGPLGNLFPQAIPGEITIKSS